MDVNGFFTAFKDYGLLGLMCSAVIGLLFKIVMWTYAEVKESRIQHEKEREAWIASQKIMADAINRNVSALEMHDVKANERGRYSREEHQKLIASMDEVQKALGRINGYTDKH
jgi:hypothetical protein